MDDTHENNSHDKEDKTVFNVFVFLCCDAIPDLYTSTRDLGGMTKMNDATGRS